MSNTSILTSMFATRIMEGACHASTFPLHGRTHDGRLAPGRRTLSKFVAGVLRDRDTSGLWPHGFFDLYGACDDDTLVEPPDDPFDLEPIPALELA